VASDRAPEPLICHACGHRPPEGDERTTCPVDGLVLVQQSEHARAPDDPYLGRTIAGKYAIVGLLGAGGMGAVYRAVQEPVGREVALKVIRSTGDDRLKVQRRFEMEAGVVAGLTHPNTVTLYDFGVHEDGTLYMVLELVRGRPLAAEIGQGPMPYPRVVRIVAGVLDALVEAHDLGLVHRDLKPANIMLVQTRWGSESVRVLDFGIAKAVGGEAAAADQLTQTGMVFGTPRYMAPEQATGKEIDARTDLYALGVVAWQCLTGSAPFEADNTFELLLAHRQQELPPMEPELGVPEALAAAVRRALAKAPGDRFPDARSMADALRAATGMAVGEEAPADVAAGPEGAALPATRPAAPAALHHAETVLAEQAGTAAPGAAVEAATTAPAGSTRRPVALVAATCVLGLAGVGVWLLANPGAERPRPATTRNVPSEAPVPSDDGEEATAGGPAGAAASDRGDAAHAPEGRAGPAAAAQDAGTPEADEPKRVKKPKRARPRRPARRPKPAKPERRRRDLGAAVREGVQVEEF